MIRAAPLAAVLALLALPARSARRGAVLRETMNGADESVVDDVIEPSSALVRETVYRLRKAGTAEREPDPTGPS